MKIGTSEAEPIWTEFLRKLTRRGLRGVKLVSSDAHEGLRSRRQQCAINYLAALPGSAFRRFQALVPPDRSVSPIPPQSDDVS